MNPFSKIQRRLARLQRHRAFRGTIREAARGNVEFAPFPAMVTPQLEITHGDRVLNPQLRAILRKDELGSWAFDAATLELLEFLFKRSQPQIVLEFGVGVSTLALALWMKNQWKDGRTRVYSVEQNQWQIEKTRERLRYNRLEKQVEIFHAPLRVQTLFSIEQEFYDLPETALTQLALAKPDWVIVDGPAGNDLVRFGTLAQLENVVPVGATWFLDDATRPEERAVMQEWAQLPFLEVAGTYAVGKGLACGSFSMA